MRFREWRELRESRRALIDPGWDKSLRRGLRRSRKPIKVGFGPIFTDETTLGNRKWHIDPIVDELNRHHTRYACGVFVEGEPLDRYDIIVVVKHEHYPNAELVNHLQSQGKRVIYRGADLEFHNPETRENALALIRSVDGILASNPLSADDFRIYADFVEVAPTPVINTLHKVNYGKTRKVSLIWQGFRENLETMEPLHRILKQLLDRFPNQIEMVFHTDVESREDGAVRFKKWKIDDWEQTLIDSDIGVVIKPTDDPFQQRKPPTKVLSYMAAGLPVVCTPSASDRLVIEEGKTGFFAETEEEWFEVLSRLIESPSLRESVGTAARLAVQRDYSVAKISQLYADFFEKVESK
ncbi:MAG: glycosyltransferase [Verrucomicrobiota bacterium]